MTEYFNKFNDMDMDNMKYYISKYSNNWEDYINFNDKVPYTRNLMYSDDKIDVYLICWTKNSYSVIHNHPKDGCIMKLLEGELEEELYNTNLELVDTRKICKNDVTYIDDTIGLHKIIARNNVAISLHIYSPPNFVTTKFSKL